MEDLATQGYRGLGFRLWHAGAANLSESRTDSRQWQQESFRTPGETQTFVGGSPSCHPPTVPSEQRGSRKAPSSNASDRIDSMLIEAGLTEKILGCSVLARLRVLTSTSLSSPLRNPAGILTLNPKPLRNPSEPCLEPFRVPFYESVQELC